MDIGWIGLGKLGLPCAVAVAQKGHNVYGLDANRGFLESYRKGISNLYEPGLDDQLCAALPRMSFLDSVEEVVTRSKIIFVAVQTPHPPELDGSIRHNHVRKDFNYDYLLSAVREVAEAVNRCSASEHKVVAVVSTVLPGTTRQIVYPAMHEIIDRPIGQGWGLCYNPFFIAMGTTVRDYLNPEFSLIGQNLTEDRDSNSGEMLAEFYGTLHDSPKLRMTWDNAEVVKMCYNTFIGLKIMFANTIMQICHGSPGADCDVVAETLGQATDRLISRTYLRGGMGDGGGCHPRDNLALSYLSDKLKLDYNIFDFVMTVREKQTEWLADLMCAHDLPKVILGETFKPKTDLTTGSPSILLANILGERGEKVTFHDPVTAPELPPRVPSVYLVGTRWEQFKEFDFAPGSIVIDPWRMIDVVPSGVELVSVGRNPG